MMPTLGPCKAGAQSLQESSSQDSGKDFVQELASNSKHLMLWEQMLHAKLGRDIA